jgi:hypothetical protein
LIFTDPSTYEIEPPDDPKNYGDFNPTIVFPAYTLAATKPEFSVHQVVRVFKESSRACGPFDLAGIPAVPQGRDNL